MARKKRDFSDPIDVHIGKRIREIRNARGILLETVGSGLGLTWQQVQKYEKGTNRITASTLLRIAKILDVPTTAFFGGLTDPVTNKPFPSIDIEQENVIRKLERLDPELVDLIIKITGRMKVMGNKTKSI